MLTPASCRLSLRQCRQFAGYTWAATAIPREVLEISGAENLTWFQSSDHARRGFCRLCGSHLFWDEAGNQNLSIAAGSVDQEAALKLGKHIYVQDKPPYYSIPAEEI